MYIASRILYFDITFRNIHKRITEPKTRTRNNLDVKAPRISRSYFAPRRTHGNVVKKMDASVRVQVKPNTENVLKYIPGKVLLFERRPELVENSSDFNHGLIPPPLKLPPIKSLPRVLLVGNFLTPIPLQPWRGNKRTKSWRPSNRTSGGI